MLTMSVTYQCTYRTYFLEIASLTDQIKLFIWMKGTKNFQLWRWVFYWAFKSERWGLLKLSFFKIFCNIHYTDVFRNILCSTFSNNSLWLAIRTCKNFAISFDLKRQINAFLTKSMSTFRDYPRDAIIRIVLKFTDRTCWHVAFIFWCAVEHEFFLWKRKFNFFVYNNEVKLKTILLVIRSLIFYMVNSKLQKK